MAGLKLIQSHWQTVRELTWEHAAGKVIELKPVFVGQTHLQGATVLLYEGQVLVSYSDSGQAKRQWVALRQLPKSIGDLSRESAQLVGATCIIRWNPKKPNQFDVEIN